MPQSPLLSFRSREQQEELSDNRQHPIYRLQVGPDFLQTSQPLFLRGLLSRAVDGSRCERPVWYEFWVVVVLWPPHLQWKSEVLGSPQMTRDYQQNAKTKPRQTYMDAIPALLSSVVLLSC